jgi:spore coat polysaccharide biosynthesis predicted glycosyltransferase SpsG
MSMRFVFRADASPVIGAGHVMRSSAIAEEAIARGIPTVFIGVTSELPWVSERIHNLGFTEVISKESRFKSDPARDILILDSYTIPTERPFVQPPNWLSIVSVADDFTPPYKSSLTIYPSLEKSWTDSSEVNIVGGPMYIPLRKSIRKSNPQTRIGALEIVVVGGGSDGTDFVSAVTRVLSKAKTEFHVNLFTDNYESLFLDHRFTVNPIGQDLDEIAQIANLVFTTASTSSLEFLARGTVVAIGCAVNNQKQYYKELGGGGFAAPIGEFLNGTWNLNVGLILELLNSQPLRAKLIANSEGFIDLNGAKRIVDEILKL